MLLSSIHFNRKIFNFINKRKIQSFIPIAVCLSGLSLISGISLERVSMEYRTFFTQPAPLGGVFPPYLPTVSYLGSTPNKQTRFLTDQRRFPRRIKGGQAALRGFCHPLRGKGFLSQGNRGPTHQGRMEFAYDLGTPIGTPVYAMQSGRVIGIQEQYTDEGGTRSQAQKANFVWLKHTQGIASAYTHLQQDFGKRTSLRLNDWVKAGQLIGYSGNSGWSSAPHLHVEVHRITDQSFGQTLPFSISSNCSSAKLTHQWFPIANFHKI